MIILSNFCDQSWTFYRRNRHQCGQKSHSTLNFCNFLNREHSQLPNLRQLQYFTNTLWKFLTNCSNRLLVVLVRVKWGQIYISLQSNAAWNLIIIIYCTEINQQYFCPLLPWKTTAIDIMLRNMAWRHVKNLNKIFHFWNIWVKGFQMVYRLSDSVDILEETLISQPLSINRPTWPTKF